MARDNGAERGTLGLRPGEIIEVKSASEILATLDPNGMIDGLPFMPEMLQYCGKQYRVYKRADKTCDTIGSSPTPSRKMADAVHLESLRCDGASHGGCQAQCLLFWKEAWLKRPGRVAHAEPVAGSSGGVPPELLQLTTRRSRAGGAGATSYVCQATELVRATTELPWWDARQYARDLWSGNVKPWTFVRTLAIAAFNAVQRRRGGNQYPAVLPQCQGETPTGALNLQPGELVRIRSKKEIFATLNQRGRNRGLYFDVEMVPFCGRTAVVKHRVDQIIDEKTGEMIHMSNPCIILDGVVCGGCLSRERLFCPRAIYSYWREIWLERVVPVGGRDQETAAATPRCSASVEERTVDAAAV